MALPFADSSSLGKTMTSAGKVIRLYFDDSGSRIPDQDEPDREDGINGFALGGVLIDEVDVDATNVRHAEFITKWSLTGPLHSTKIRGKRDQFRFLRKHPKRDIFRAELDEFMATIPALGLACVIHRPGYNARYKEAHGPNRWRMCKTAASILIERAAKYADSQDAKLKVLFEECGKREDRDTIAYARSLKREGMPFDQNNAAKYNCLQPDDFKRIILGEPHRITKEAGIVQVADLYLYAMIKGGYDEMYAPYKLLRSNKRLIDDHLPLDEISLRGIKYSCFDFKNAKGPV
jgi:hypothetical protein